MKFKVFSDYNNFVESDITGVLADEISTIIKELNWNVFNQIILIQDDSNWLEITGILNEYQMSCMYVESNNENFIEIEPKSVPDIIDLLLNYYYDIEGFKNQYNTQVGVDEVLKTDIKNEKRARKQIKKKKDTLFSKSFRENKTLGIVLIFIPIIGLLVLRFFDANVIAYYISVFSAIIIWTVAFIKNMVAEKLSIASKEKELIKLKSNSQSYKLKINSDKIPTQFASYIYIFEKWGVKNPLLRDDLYEEASEDELKQLKSIEIIIPELKKYISNYNGIDYVEKEAIKLTLKAYHDLGLWTWN